MKYINLIPRWAEILPTWLMLYESAVLGDHDEPAKAVESARDELKRMAKAADKFNDLVAALRDEGWANSAFSLALTRGRELQEIERNTVRETEDDLP